MKRLLRKVAATVGCVALVMGMAACGGAGEALLKAKRVHRILLLPVKTEEKNILFLTVTEEPLRKATWLKRAESLQKVL